MSRLSEAIDELISAGSACSRMTPWITPEDRLQRQRRWWSAVRAYDAAVDTEAEEKSSAVGALRHLDEGEQDEWVSRRS